MAELHALLAEFASPAELLEAARALRGRGYRRLDAFTPFPVAGLAEVLGARSRAVPVAMLVGGVSGAVAGFAMQAWISLDFPLRIGGRPLIAVPAFMLIVFELMVLGAVLAGIAAMLAGNRLPRLHHPVFDAARFDLSADDRFFLAILAGEDFDRDREGKALAALRPRAIVEVPA